MMLEPKIAVSFCSHDLRTSNMVASPLQFPSNSWKPQPSLLADDQQMKTSVKNP